MHGLVVGRFQPLHNGHASLIRAAIEDCVHVTVGIGSSNAKRSATNPFSFDERKAMIQAVFGDTVKVVAIPDIHDPPNWANHVVELTGAVDKVFGNDRRTLDLFEDAGIPVRETGQFQRRDNEGTNIRILMAEDDPEWRKHVPKGIIQLLEELEAGKRLRMIEATA